MATAWGSDPIQNSQICPQRPRPGFFFSVFSYRNSSALPTRPGHHQFFLFPPKETPFWSTVRNLDTTFFIQTHLNLGKTWVLLFPMFLAMFCTIYTQGQEHTIQRTPMTCIFTNHPKHFSTRAASAVWAASWGLSTAHCWSKNSYVSISKGKFTLPVPDLLHNHLLVRVPTQQLFYNGFALEIQSHPTFS